MLQPPLATEIFDSDFCTFTLRYLNQRFSFACESLLNHLAYVLIVGRFAKRR
jgi:hypothetical protein